MSQNKGGRPCEYREEVADAICERLADGESLRTICLDEDMPSKATVFKWLGRFPEFADQYARAREEQAESFADELVAISDEQETAVKDGAGGTTMVVFDATAVARNRLRIDARKWVASKLKPKKYGDKIQQEVTGADGSPFVVKILSLSDQGKS